VNGSFVSFPASVDPMSFIEIELELAPSFAGEWRDNVHVLHSEGSARIQILASAFGESGCELAVASPLDFGVVPIGGRLSSTTPITNVGTAACNVESLGLTPGSDPAFALIQPPPMTIFYLQPGEQLAIDFEFAPTMSGPHTGEYRFFSQELGERRQIELVGRGASQSLPRYSVTFVPNVPLAPAGGNTLAFTNPDDGFAQVSLAFPFELAGTPVTEAFVGTNGVIAFGGSAGLQSFVNVPIPSASDPNAFIAWWWDDLEVSASSTVRTSISGAAPARVQTFTFLDLQRFSDGASRVSAEVRLYEQGSLIEAHYGAIQTGGGDFDATAGWESFGGTDGEDVLGCNPDCTSLDWPADTILRYTPSP
jgi:hypothetical protein